MYHGGFSVKSESQNVTDQRLSFRESPWNRNHWVLVDAVPLAFDQYSTCKSVTWCPFGRHSSYRQSRILYYPWSIVHVFIKSFPRCRSSFFHSSSQTPDREEPGARHIHIIIEVICLIGIIWFDRTATRLQLDSMLVIHPSSQHSTSSKHILRS